MYPFHASDYVLYFFQLLFVSPHSVSFPLLFLFLSFLPFVLIPSAPDITWCCIPSSFPTTCHSEGAAFPFQMMTNATLKHGSFMRSYAYSVPFPFVPTSFY
ncbi:hypothetical protein I7I53_03795 [Histoplasma capsulatum var. duboisii H88]|uniref:Uncharacterized protein n=1 Tax=Ajellomyces capsulatus (strain H88) TaxID=544711 RepID=A0A8A1LPE9_AJEC8|nr:hypothetical protein I7I53_03795 [Histoplasma capsulatum var. duboisii H88]